MNEQVSEYLSKYPGEIVSLFQQLRQLIFESAASAPEETLWARMPSYYVGDSFVRLIPFKDHINIEAKAIMQHQEELAGYKITPKGMLQVYVKQKFPAAVLKRIFSETLRRRTIMNVLILMGSPRRFSNTTELCKPFMEELKENGAEVRYVTLVDKTINPCKGCYACQQVEGSYGCVQHDDMYAVVDDIRWADLIVLATPIYAWFCPACMKAVLDRHYGLNKFYGSASGSLWAGKQVAILATHGYEGDYATGPFETAVQRLCIHSKLDYVGLYSVEDEDDLASFQTAEAKAGAREFARRLLERPV